MVPRAGLRKLHQFSDLGKGEVQAFAGCSWAIPRTWIPMRDAPAEPAPACIGRNCPQFRFATAQRDHHPTAPPPRDGRDHRITLERVTVFIACKQAATFFPASELAVPDCVEALGFRTRRCTAAWQASAWQHLEVAQQLLRPDSQPHQAGERASRPQNLEDHPQPVRPRRDETVHPLLAPGVALPPAPLAPGILITAPEISGAGSGKGLLARSICTIAFGREPFAVTAGTTRQELEKRIAAELISGSPSFLLDNLSRPLARSG